MMRKWFVSVTGPMVLIIALPINAQQSCNDNIQASTPDTRFKVAGNEVTDTQTGLIWQKCSVGQQEEDCVGTPNSYNWSEALQAAENTQISTNVNWRVPNLKELSSIIEFKCYNPSINLNLFPNTADSLYWTSSSYAYDADYAWGIKFKWGSAYANNGGSFSNHKVNSRLNLRLVRNLD